MVKQYLTTDTGDAALNFYLDENPERVLNKIEDKKNYYATQLLEQEDAIMHDITHIPTAWERFTYRIKRLFGL